MTITQQPESPLAPPAQKPVKQKNVLGLIALIASVVGFVFACIPGALILGWVLLPVAFILGIVGAVLSGKRKAASIAAIIIAVVGTIVGFVVFFTVVTGAVGDAVKASTGSGDTSVTLPNGAKKTDTPAKPAAAEVGTRNNPYPIGSKITDGDWDLVVNSVTLDATQAISAANAFNDAPASGSQFLMVNITATYNGNDPDGKDPLVSVDYVTKDGNTIDGTEKLIVPPDQFDMMKTLYEGASTTGNLAFEVPSATVGDGTLAVRAALLGHKVFVSVQ